MPFMGTDAVAIHVRGGSRALPVTPVRSLCEMPVQQVIFRPLYSLLSHSQAKPKDGGPHPGREGRGPGHRNQLGANRGANARVQVAVSTDSMPMYDSLARQIEYLLLEGGDYHDAPNLGSDVLDRDRHLRRPVPRPPQSSPATRRCCGGALLVHGLLGAHAAAAVRLAEGKRGKTRALTVTKHLVPRPEHIADLTAAGLYHSIDEALKSRVVGRPSCTTSSTPCSALPRKAESATRRCGA